MLRSRSGPSIGCRKKCSKSSDSNRSGSRAGLREDELELVAAREHEWRAPAFGLTQIQSMPARAALRAVGLDRDLEAARVQRVDERRVELQQRLAAGAHDERSRAAHVRDGQRRRDGVGERRRRVANLPPSGPDADEIGVAERGTIASARSASRPVHRLQPAKRQNTAGRPAFAPSPCSV